MKSYDEGPVIIDGLKSWFESVYITREKSPDDFKPSYHYHNYIEFLYSIKSDAIVLINDERYPFKSGDLVVINSNENHDLFFNGHSEYICVKFSPNALYSENSAFFEYRYAIPFLSDVKHQKRFAEEEIRDTDIKKLCVEIWNEWNTRNYAFELIVRADILKIFSLILRGLEAQGVFGTDRTIPENMKKAVRYVAENYDKATVYEAAKISGLSYNHFSAAFKQSLGKNFKDFLISVRIKEAEKMLLSTEKNMTEIAIESGFTTSSHFIANFKKYKGITPKQFRIKLNSSLKSDSGVNGTGEYGFAQ